MADADVAAAMAGSFLGELSSELVGQLPAVGDRADYPAGSTIYREGSAPRTLLVVRGLLRVYLSSPEGRQVTVRYACDPRRARDRRPRRGPADVGVQTLADSTLFRIDAATLTAAARGDSRVAWTLAEELNRRLYENLQQTAINAFGSVRQRIAAQAHRYSWREVEARQPRPDHRRDPCAVHRITRRHG